MAATIDADATLTSDDHAMIAEEMAMHDRVKHAVRAEALVEGPDMEQVKARLIELRDEAISASERDLPALFQQLYTHHSLAARTYEKKLPDMRAPYFARMRLLEAGKARDILIGYQTFIDQSAGVTIIDWRHAVLSKVFFNYKQGDEYELQLPGRLAQGELEVRRVIAFDVGELVGITGPDFTLTRQRGGTWRKIADAGVPSLAGGAGKAVNVHQFGATAQRRKIPDVSALLDREQYEILNREDHGALLILGGAGSGKTTIALHRLALLQYRSPRFYQQKAMKVVVPEQGLVRLTERLLRGLGMEDVSVGTYDSFVTDQGKHILKGIPKRLFDGTPAAAIVAKRHPAMFDVIERYVGLLTARVVERARFLFDWMKAPVDHLADDPDTPLVPRLERFADESKDFIKAMPGDTASQWKKSQLETFMVEAMKQVLDVEHARSELYSNPELLEILKAKSGGAVVDRMIGELTRHTKRQFEEPDADIDAKILEEARTVDDHEVDKDDYAGTIDVEDYTVLLVLQLMLHGRIMRKTKGMTLYKHLVVDEAQDISPLELRVLGQGLDRDATLTVAGDAVQQSDPTVAFRGWDDVLAQLGVEAVEEARLNTNYRCPRSVAEFGHKVLGPMAPKELPQSVKEGMDVVFSTFPNDGLAIVAMSEALTALFDREALASVAVICENETSARAFYDGLSFVGDVRLVIDGEFSFKPGIDVTDVSQIKGLEFDYVIIPDANLQTYPDTPVARRTLHIAITRAVHQLWVISIGRPSEILA